MLSRVADSLYWMSRYLERAENQARLIDVNLQILLDFGQVGVAQDVGELAHDTGVDGLVIAGLGSGLGTGHEGDGASVPDSGRHHFDAWHRQDDGTSRGSASADFRGLSVYDHRAVKASGSTDNSPDSFQKLHHRYRL